MTVIDYEVETTPMFGFMRFAVDFYPKGTMSPNTRRRAIGEILRQIEFAKARAEGLEERWEAQMTPWARRKRRIWTALNTVGHWLGHPYYPVCARLTLSSWAGVPTDESRAQSPERTH